MTKVKEFTTPFGHISYALVTSEAELTQYKLMRPELSRVQFKSSGQMSTHDLGGAMYILVSLPLTDYLEGKDTLAGLLGVLTHECVHIYQELIKLMNEEDPSSEFEAYSIQKIFEDLTGELISRVM